MVVAGRKGLLLSSEQYVSAAVVAGFLSDRGLQPDNTVVITQSGSLPMGVIGLQDGLVDVALSISPISGFHDAKLLGEIRRVLRAGGALTVEEPVTARPLSAAEAQAAGMASGHVLGRADVEKGLLFAGFAEAAPGAAISGGGADAARFGPLAAPAGPLTTVAITSKKPNWEVGAKSSLKLRKRPKADKPGFDADAISKAWGNAAEGGDEAMVDEESLLTADDLAAPAAEAKGDCSTSRKACKNCVCGRKEMEAGDVPGNPVNLSNPYLTQEQLDNPQSACGSCGLGDAFRCATCPYRGMPAFAPGEKITIGSNLLDADMDV